MQRRRVVKGQGGNNQDEGTARRVTRKPSEERVEETGKKKSGVLRKLGFILHPDKQDTGSTVKKRKPKKATERKRRQVVWNPDKKVHFNIEKAHLVIPLKGEQTVISDVQKKVFHKFATEAVKKGPMEYSAEFMSKVKPYVGVPMERKVFDANPTKNRYKDVVCNDVTRVILNDGYDGDYIHANYVNGLNVPFILTQGPTAATIIDFWRMIFHTKTSYIVMLCEVLEDGKPKCAMYWPEKVGETANYGMWSVSCVSEDDKDSNIFKRTLSMKNTENGKEHMLKHLHTKSWPDKSVPNSTLSLLRMLFTVRQSPGPVTVHCSAGIGRTGTFVAVEACLQILTDGKDLDLMGTVKALRNSRGGSVQVDVQYLTLVQIIINYGKDNGYWEDSDLDDRVELLTWNIEQFINTRGRVDHLMATPSTPNLVVAATPAPIPTAPTPPPATPAREVPGTQAKAPPLPEKPKQQKKDTNGLVTKDSTEEAEDNENDPKVQATQRTDIQLPDDAGLATVIPMAPTHHQTTSPVLTTPPSPPKKKKSKEERINSKEEKLKQLRNNRSEYFM